MVAVGINESMHKLDTNTSKCAIKDWKNIYNLQQTINCRFLLEKRMEMVGRRDRK